MHNLKQETIKLFLRSNIKLQVTKTRVVTSKHGKAQQYKVVLTNGKETLETTFTDSIYNYCHNNELDYNDVLYCLLADASAYENTTDITDFAAQFGYENIDKLLKVYNACKETSEKLNKIFSILALKKLKAIYEEY